MYFEIQNCHIMSTRTLQSILKELVNSFSEPPKLEGTLAPNTILASAQKAYEGQLKGPECIAVHEGKCYL